MDEYIVYINDYQTRYYYKNGLLHRESGPAVIKRNEIELYQNLIDKQPYKEIMLNTYNAPKNYEGQFLPNENKLTWYTATHYLEGKPYSQKDFEEIKGKIDLKNELSSELTKNESKSKNLKI